MQYLRLLVDGTGLVVQEVVRTGDIGITRSTANTGARCGLHVGQFFSRHLAAGGGFEIGEELRGRLLHTDRDVGIQRLHFDRLELLVENDGLVGNRDNRAPQTSRKDRGARCRIDGHGAVDGGDVIVAKTGASQGSESDVIAAGRCRRRRAKAAQAGAGDAVRTVKRAGGNGIFAPVKDKRLAKGLALVVRCQCQQRFVDGQRAVDVVERVVLRRQRTGVDIKVIDACIDSALRRSCISHAAAGDDGRVFAVDEAADVVAVAAAVGQAVISLGSGIGGDSQNGGVDDKLAQIPADCIGVAAGCNNGDGAFFDLVAACVPVAGINARQVAAQCVARHQCACADGIEQRVEQGRAVGDELIQSRDGDGNRRRNRVGHACASAGAACFEAVVVTLLHIAGGDGNLAAVRAGIPVVVIAEFVLGNVPVQNITGRNATRGRAAGGVDGCTRGLKRAEQACLCCEVSTIRAEFAATADDEVALRIDIDVAAAAHEGRALDLHVTAAQKSAGDQGDVPAVGRNGAVIDIHKLTCVKSYMPAVGGNAVAQERNGVPRIGMRPTPLLAILTFVLKLMLLVAFSTTLLEALLIEVTPMFAFPVGRPIEWISGL